MKSYYTNKLIKISFLLLCLMAIIINIHAMDNDEDTVTVSRVKYDTIMNENEIMQNEIARLQNLLKSRKRFREVLPTQSAQLGHPRLLHFFHNHLHVYDFSSNENKYTYLLLQNYDHAQNLVYFDHMEHFYLQYVNMSRQFYLHHR